ncbi:hypothetical protein Cgig2_002375 [Carnegiea gigantea]|uniref:DUF4283 domain-containing protein n=1 Tax=Carnegiea gigantea TaxID=171969 RepID=A0A9Q1GL57_9CARY|nr:hypothetical protein Cgig2_002375 [Carnegiea gigantea]
MADKDEVLKKGIYYFDGKPFIVKAWNENLVLDINSLNSLPMWVQFPKLDGVESLSKLGSLIRIPLKTDKQKMDKTFLNKVVLLIDIPLEGPFSECVDYINDKGMRVKFEWELVKCDYCSMYGHLEEECRKKKVVRQEWRMTSQNKKIRQVQQATPTKYITPRRTTRRSPSNMRENEDLITNSFQALLETEILDMVSQESMVIHALYG